jgi:PAS domain S-box-containing protein
MSGNFQGGQSYSRIEKTMKIRTLINILVAISLALLVLAFGRLYTSTREVERHNDDALAVQKLFANISKLRFILAETMLNRENRSGQLSASNLQSLRDALNHHVYTLPGQNQLVEKIQNRQANLYALYSRLNAVTDSSVSIEARQELFSKTASALLLVTHEMLDDVTEINRLNREALLSVSDRRQIVSFLIVMLFGAIILVFWLMIRKFVLAPVQRLQHGIELIASGDLSHRFDMAGKNEIELLAGMFDMMTEQLQQSVAAMRAKIYEREATQKQLAHYSEQLARDLAARKLAEESLLIAQAATKLSELRMRHVMNSAFIGIIECDYNGRFIDANDTFIELTGRNRASLISEAGNWQSLAPGQFHPTMQQALKELATIGKTAPFESALIRPDRSTVPILMGLSRLEGSDQEWVGFLLDLTERHRGERIKSEFISVVSHELRTPLTAIRGALGLLESGVVGTLPPQAFKLVQIAHSNSQRLGGLVNDILDMDKLISGKMIMAMQPVDLVALARQAIEANAGYAAVLQAGVSYVLGSHPDTAWVNGDPDRLMQVFANLLSNAAKFSSPGQNVEIRVKREDDKARVEIEDHGAGIPEAFRGRIFDAFAQANSGDTRQQGGTGLGLKISKTLIEEMNGEIGFESEVGSGTTFWFALNSLNAPHLEDRASRDIADATEFGQHGATEKSE